MTVNLRGRNCLLAAPWWLPLEEWKGIIIKSMKPNVELGFFGGFLVQEEYFSPSLKRSIEIAQATEDFMCRHHFAFCNFWIVEKAR